MNERSTKDGPWCWQEKAARRKIREAFDATHNVATALSVYDALTEIASDAGREVFTTTEAWVQNISGVGVRTLSGHLKTFAEMGLVSCLPSTGLRVPKTYTLLPFGNGCATSGSRCGTFGNDQFHAPLPTSEEKEESERTQKKEAATAPLVPLLLNVPEFLAPWQQWEAIRRKGKKPKTSWAEYFAKQLAWLESFGLQTAVEIVATSARNEWDGLFAHRGGNGKPPAKESKFAGSF